MFYVKNYNPGQIRMDLPTANYIHELPLLSFSDIHGSVNLSLVFNYAMKAESSNPFNIAAGYKLNLQKRLIMENNVPVQFQDESGKCVDLIGDGFPYVFDDDSQRILRATGNSLTPYIVESADFSTEKYYANGMIASVIDKYGIEVLTYEYDLDDGRDEITYRGAKIITLYYGSSGLSAITFDGKSTGLVCQGSNVSVAHYSGVTHNLVCSDVGFSATAQATENSATVSHKTQVVKNSTNNTMTISDIIDDVVVNTTVYKFPEEPEHDNYCSQVDITDNRGTQTRIQYQDGKPLYSYEILDTGDWALGTDPTVLETRFKSNVTLYGPQGNPGNYKATGVQTRKDGMTMHSLEANGQWLADMSSNTNAEGYYILSGWMKSNKNNISSSTISIGQSLSTLFNQWEINLAPVGQWKYFSCMFYTPPSSIYAVVNNENVNQIDGDVHVADLRLTFQKSGVLEDDEPSHTNMTEYVLTDGIQEIPFKDASFYYSGNGNTMTFSGVTATDILRWKLRYKKVGSCNEVYLNKCKEIITDIPGLSVSYNSKSYNILALNVVAKTHSRDNVHLTVMNMNEIDLNANIRFQTYTNGVLVGVQELNNKLDTVASADSDILTRYIRTNDLVTAETVFNTTSLANMTTTAALFSRSTSYDEPNAKITATDEFGNQIQYTLDPTWGNVTAVSVPGEDDWETVYADEYDDDMCALMERTFGAAAGRSNSLTYAGGNLSGLQSGTLGYTFTHTQGELTGIKKNGADVEVHEHIVQTGSTYPNQADSYYPAKSGALHSTSAVFDKYGRLTSIDGVLTNVYDIAPRFHSTTGALIPSADNGSALLAMTTDEVRSETAKFTYTDNGQLAKKVVAKETDLTDEISLEEFTYDAVGRMTKATCHYDSANSRSVEQVLDYIKQETDPSPDERVGTSTYKVNGIQKVQAVNYFDTCRRLYRKETTFTSHPITKTLTYNKTRVSSAADIFRSNNLGTNNYGYDDMGRIRSDSYSCAYASGDYRTYEYDEYGQLRRENNQGLAKTFEYEYNEIGNLTAVKAYPFTLSATLTGTPVTTTFGYTDDRLTSFGGATMGYNAMCCPTSYEGKTATWSKGKLSRLSQGTKFTGMSTYNYGYNGYGQRISRSYSYTAGTSGTGAAQLGQLTACTRKYYYDHAGRLIAEDVTKTYYGEGTTTENIVFLYDESGIIGMELTTGGVSSLYYFQRNLQGDVVAIYDTNGTLKAKYLYDAWGNCTIASETTSYDVANANPIRYRGYYYDDDTGLYYCNARYYSPKWRRFISPDDTAYLNPENVNGLNLYCYCNNDPISIKCSYGAVEKSHLPAAVSAGHSTSSGINKPATGNWPVSTPMLHSKFALFGYEWRRSAGWEHSSTLLSNWLVRIGFSSYVTHTSGKPGILYAFAGTTSDVMSLLDATYYAGVGLDLFGILGAEVQAEFLGVGATISLGRLSIGVNANLLAPTSLAFTWDTDLGSNLMRSDGFTIGINTPGVLMLVALACTYIWAVLHGIDPSAVPKPGYA